MRKILAAVTDKQTMHTLGLMNPETILYKKGENNEPIPYTPELTPDQIELWATYENIIETAIDVARGDPIALIELGDQTQGTVFPSDVESVRMADHVLSAKWCLYPWLSIPNLTHMFLVVGTGVHEWDGSVPVLIADDLSMRYPNVEITPVYHGIAEVGNYRVDCTHHGPNQSIRTWLNGNSARYYLQNEMMKDLMDGKEPPNLYLRGHFHSLIYEIVNKYVKDRWFTSTIIVVPPLCLLGDHARKRTMSASLVTTGGVVFEIENDKLVNIHWILKTKDIRRRLSI